MTKPFVTTALAPPRILSLGCLLALFTLLSGCFRAERTESAEFTSATVMDGGEVGLFTASYTETHYTGGGGFGDRGRRVFDHDRLYIGAYDLPDGGFRVLHEEEAEWGAMGQSGYRLRSTRASRAVLSRHCGFDSQDKSRAGWYLLDVDAVRLDALHLELAARGRGAGEVVFVHLVSDEGDLLVVSMPDGESGGYTLSLVRPDGTWVAVSERANYRGLRSGELFYWTREDGSLAYSISKGTTREPTNREQVGLDRYRETQPNCGLMSRAKRGSRDSHLEFYPDSTDSSVSRWLDFSALDLD